MRFFLLVRRCKKCTGDIEDKASAAGGPEDVVGRRAASPSESNAGSW
jgi:hypothetical protein